MKVYIVTVALIVLCSIAVEGTIVELSADNLLVNNVREKRGAVEYLKDALEKVAEAVVSNMVEAKAGTVADIAVAALIEAVKAKAAEYGKPAKGIKASSNNGCPSHYDNRFRPKCEGYLDECARAKAFSEACLCCLDPRLASG